MPRAEALLLLPVVPRAACVRRRWLHWSAALQSFGIVAYPRGRSAGSGCDLIIASARAALRSEVNQVLVEGRDSGRRLRRAGFRVVTYVARRGEGGAVQLTPGSPVRPGPVLRRLLVKGGPRRLLVAGVRRLLGISYLTVGYRGDVTPAVVAAAVGSGASASLLSGGGGERRRSTLLVADSRSAPPHTVVKVSALVGRARGLREQQVLLRIQGLKDLAPAAPRPLGEGILGGISWSAESAVAGLPLPSALWRPRDPGPIVSTLENVAAWFTRLGTVTQTARRWSDGASALPLRGEHRRLEVLRNTLQGVPGVLVHGDVGTGGNVLLNGGAFSIIDWETAAEGELPLTDLLPLLCNALAGLRGHRGAAAAERFVLSLCAGKETDSAWLLSLVRTYCGELGLPLSQAGRLGALAWGYQASMRLVHQELVAEAGVMPTDWESSADGIASGWLLDPDLGTSWPALTARSWA